MVSFSQVTKGYGPARGIQNVSFSLPTGGLIGLLGPNGAGKTTIMKLITGYHYPEAGSIRVGPFDPLQNPLEAKALIGYLPENAPLYQEMRVHEYLEFVGGTRLKRTEVGPAVKVAAEQTGITSVLARQIGHLSKGYKQRVGLAQALIHRPKLLILDEPTNGLDPNQIQEIRKLIKELAGETTILFSTHILQEVEALCSQVLIVSEGALVAQGTPREIGSQLQGKTRIRLSLHLPEDTGPQELRSQLEAYLSRASDSKFPWLVELETNDRFTFLLTPPGDIEEKEALGLLSPWIWEGKRTVLGLSAQGTGIEDLFASLTRSQEEEP